MYLPIPFYPCFNHITAVLAFIFVPLIAGKLSITDQRISVHLSIGTFASSAVGSGRSAEELASKISNKLLPFLAQVIM